MKENQELESDQQTKDVLLEIIKSEDKQQIKETIFLLLGSGSSGKTSSSFFQIKIQDQSD